MKKESSQRNSAIILAAFILLSSCAGVPPNLEVYLPGKAGYIGPNDTISYEDGKDLLECVKHKPFFDWSQWALKPRFGSGQGYIKPSSPK